MDKARYWILTIPQHDYTTYRPTSVRYIRGQLERGDTGYLHWQLVACYATQVRRSKVKDDFGVTCHAEPTKSDAALEYVWKEETSVDGTRFELGIKPVRRNSDVDWEMVRDYAKCGRLDDLPPSVFVQHYRTLRTIREDYATPIGMERRVVVYWGPTGVGKSRRAWNEAGIEAYPKDPCTKFWCGYRDQQHVVLDEFRGQIGISHVLRWFDRYPCLVELKGSSVVLRASRIWITSNLDPRDWYPDLDQATIDALLRRLEITYCPLPLYNN